MNPRLKMHGAAAQGLADLKVVLAEMDDHLYTSKITLLSGASIGQHVRHIIEFYRCVIASLDSGVVNYCLRKRDPLLETNLEQAQHITDDLMKELSDMTDNRSLSLATDLEETTVIDTNLDRELLYCVEHSVHHMATIKVGLKILMPNLEIPNCFGIADSTLKHRARKIVLED